MPEHRRLDPAVPWVEVVATEADWDAAEPSLLLSLFSHLTLIRVFEEYVLELAGAGLVHGPAHSSIGQEGGAVASVLPLTSEDTVNGSHRGHHQFLARPLGGDWPWLKLPGYLDRHPRVAVRPLAVSAALSILSHFSWLHSSR